VSWIRRLSPRAEKTLRLVVMCLIAAILGIVAVALDSPAIGYVSIAVVLVGILAGPLVARYLFREGPGGEKT
jgi:membrane associated rhomboid family serine protease